MVVYFSAIRQIYRNDRKNLDCQGLHKRAYYLSISGITAPDKPGPNPGRMNKTILCILLMLCLAFHSHGQRLYFPPIVGDVWESTDPQELDWCTEKIPELLDFLDTKNTKAFIVLKDGKIVIESYFDDFDKDKFWYWASAGKTLTAFAIGQAEAEGLIDLEANTSSYLGSGWTSLDPDQENRIKVIHQLTMTTGLDDTSGDPYCTDPDCLTYKADPGDRWAYHNAPYTLLDQVIEGATGENLNSFITDRLKRPTGMKGFFLPSGYNNVYWSDARSMARFGLLVLNNGYWQDQVIMDNPEYIEQMRTPSQALNPSYGYLWWLNGQEKFLLPGLQIPFNGSWSPSAPDDLYAGLGKNGQFLDIIPSENLVVIRMGEAPDGSLVPVLFHDDMWKLLSEVMCTITSTDEEQKEDTGVFPNPCREYTTLPVSPDHPFVLITDSSGRKVWVRADDRRVNTRDLPAGTYHLRYLDRNGYLHNYKFVKIQ